MPNTSAGIRQIDRARVMCQNDACLFDELFSRRQDPDPAAVAEKQGIAQELFDKGDMFAQRGLSDAQLARGARKVQLLSEGDYCTKGFEIDSGARHIHHLPVALDSDRDTIH